MLPACRTGGEGFAIPTFDLVPSDVAGFMEELWEFQSTFHDCFARSEPRAHFFDSMVGQCSKLERKSIEPMALEVEGGTIRGLQRFISDVVWDEEQMRWNYRLRSWRRPLPSAAVRRQSTSRPKVQRVQRLRGLSFQALHGFILNNTKIVHSYNYLIFLTFLQGIEIKSISIRL